MMRNCAAIFLLGIWLTIGAWYYVCQVKNLCFSSEENVPIEESPGPQQQEKNVLFPAALKIAYQQVFKMEEDVEFQHSASTIEIGELFQMGIDTVVEFLVNHPSTSLIITGHFTAEEDNGTSFSDLGLARAAEIKRRLVEKGVNENQLLTESSKSDDLFSNEPTYKNLIDFKFSEQYEYLNESDVKLSYKAIDFLEHHSQFFKDGDLVLFSEEPNQYVEHLSFYLNRNREHLLRIVVPFQEDELNVVDTLDIGLVRALDLKKQLIDLSLKEESVITNSERKEGLFDNSNFSFPKSIQYNFVFPDLQDDALERELALERALSKSLSEEVAVAEEETEESITEEVEIASASPLQFAPGSYTLSLTKSVNNYVQELKTYLNDNPSKEVLIIGHTDNVGDEEFNIELGRLRGYEARRLLINNRISPRRIIVISEGEYSPIASNEEVEGQRLNRRVDIDIQ